MPFSGKSRFANQRKNQQGFVLTSIGISFRSISILLMLALPTVGCSAKIATVPVTGENLLQSNEAAAEANVAFARKDYYAALIKYLEASRLNPNNDYVLNKLGVTYTQLQYFPEAAAAFERSFMLNPKYSYAYNNLGSISFARHDYKRAERLFKKAISINPKAASFHINLGRLYLEKKKKDKAVAELRKAIALDPLIMENHSAITVSASSNRSSSSEMHYSMARIYASIGDATHAVESLQQAMNTGFTSIEAIKKEPDFDPIRNDQLFVAFMKTASLVLKP
jgi:tetratricopeptide (TPR) repeat protein